MQEQSAIPAAAAAAAAATKRQKRDVNNNNNDEDIVVLKDRLDALYIKSWKSLSSFYKVSYLRN